MELFAEMFLAVFDNLHYLFLSGKNRFYYPWIISFIVFGIVVFSYRRFKLGKKTSLMDGIKYCFPKDKYMNNSSFVDIKLLAFNIVFFGIVATTVFDINIMRKFIAIAIKQGILFDLNSKVPFLNLQLSISWQGELINTFIIYFFREFGWFLAHWLEHRIPFLWEFHKIHHSASVLTPITAHRAHPFERLWIRSFEGAFWGLGLIVSMYVLGQGVSVLSIFSVSIISLVLKPFINFRHSHIWISYGPYLNYLFISPAQHQIHHSIQPEHLNKNIGRSLALWDLLFGTLYVPKNREKFEVGLVDKADENKYSTLKDVILEPFRALIQK